MNIEAMARENEPMLIQLHWQNRENLEETIFVAQTEFKDPDVFRDWMREICDRRRDECPEGWQPLACNEDAPMFVMAAHTAQSEEAKGK